MRAHFLGIGEETGNKAWIGAKTDFIEEFEDSDKASYGAARAVEMDMMGGRQSRYREGGRRYGERENVRAENIEPSFAEAAKEPSKNVGVYGGQASNIV